MVSSFVTALVSFVAIRTVEEHLVAPHPPFRREAIMNRARVPDYAPERELHELKRALRQTSSSLKYLSQKMRRMKNRTPAKLPPARRLVVAFLRRLCPETLYPAAAFLLQSQPNLVDEASAQPPIEQAVQWLRDHEDDITIPRGLSDPASSEMSPAWLRASARARDFLAKARLTQWVATCNDQQRFAPGTQQVAQQWARLRSDVDVAVGAEAAPAPVGVPSRMFLCRWRRRWNLRWGGLRCRDNFADGELLAKARLSPTKHRTNTL